MSLPPAPSGTTRSAPPPAIVTSSSKLAGLKSRTNHSRASRRTGSRRSLKSSRFRTALSNGVGMLVLYDGINEDSPLQMVKCWEAIRRLVLSGLIAGGVCARENTEPVSLIGSCELLLVDAARRSDKPVKTTCELTKTAWVVALPGEKLTLESLLSTGIPEDAALMISQRELIRPEWCFVEELAPQVRRNESSPRLQKSCIDTALVIPTVTVVRTDRIVITAARADGGTVKLIRLSASQ